MDRAEGALLVAEKALEEVKRLSEALEQMKAAAPKGAVSFLIDDTGDLILVEPGSGAKSLGRVRGLDGRDATVFSGASIDDQGQLQLTKSNGEAISVGKVVGAPGRDGLSFDAFTFDAEYDGERTVTLKWADATGVAQSRQFVFPIVIYRGVFKDGTDYQRGDSVTFGGSLFIAMEDTTGKPEATKSWALSAKRGHDGKAGKNGERGPQGLEGKSGRDLTQMDSTGAKW